MIQRYWYKKMCINYSTVVPPFIRTNRIGGVMVSMFVTSAADRGFEPDHVRPKTIKLVFVASPISKQH